MNHWGATTCNLTGGTGWLYRSENSQAKFGWQDADGYHHPSTNCTSTANFGVMNTMFYFGPWADPPWIDEGHRTLMSIAAVLCLWRAYRRLTVDMRARRCDGSG